MSRSVKLIKRLKEGPATLREATTILGGYGKALELMKKRQSIEVYLDNNQKSGIGQGDKCFWVRLGPNPHPKPGRPRKNEAKAP